MFGLKALDSVLSELTEREGAKLLVASEGREHAAIAVALVKQATSDLCKKDRLGVMTPGLAIQMVLQRLRAEGEEDFRYEDTFSRLPLWEVISITLGAQELCTIMLENIHFHLGN